MANKNSFNKSQKRNTSGRFEKGSGAQPGKSGIASSGPAIVATTSSAPSRPALTPAAAAVRFVQAQRKNLVAARGRFFGQAKELQKAVNGDAAALQRVQESLGGIAIDCNR